MDAKDRQLFMKRSSNIFGGQTRRAEKAGATLDFNLAELRAAVFLRIGTNCEHCQQPITVGNFSVDHREPTSRGGSFSISNTDIVCLRCNQIKGALTRAEFDGLMQCIAGWNEQARRSLFARLRAGGRLFHN